MLQIPTDERSVTDSQVLSAFDLSLPALTAVREAVEKGDTETAKAALVDYFHNRCNVKFLFDYRGQPLTPMDPDDSPYSYQSSLGFSGSLRAFCLRVADKMMHNIYLLPGADRGEVDLGKNFENMIHFNFLEDEGKRHRHHLDMFVRGQFFESLAVLYHEKGDRAVAEQFKRVLHKFFETYPLQVVDTSPAANRFQYDEDRDAMSVGWLVVVFISLFYTELPYAVDYDTAFQILKRIWFLGLQFRRFDTDQYKPYNHHMWERGLVPFILGTLLPEIPDFVAMRERGAGVVCRHVKEDFNPQGGYNEHSIAYWSGAAVGEMLYRGLYIARLNNQPLLDEDALGRIDSTFGVLAAICPPAARYPSLGDNGGPEINPILRLGVKMADNARCKALLAVRDQGKPADPAVLPLDYCDDTTGFACMRSDYTHKANYLLMSVKTNCGATGHNHMDMLSLFLTLGGEPIFGEPYSGKLYHNIKMGSKQRGYMYNMGAHNTVLAFGQPVAPDSMYCNKWGVYRSDSPVSAFWSSDKGSYLSAYHVGYTYCRHTRRLLFARNGALLLREEIDRGSRMEQAHIQRWHLEPGCVVTPVDQGALLIQKNGTRVLCVWEGCCGIEIGSLAEMLCPDIYPDESSLAPVVDVLFKNLNDKKTDLLMVPLTMLVLDITGREEPDIAALRAQMCKMAPIMQTGEALEQLYNL